MASSIVFKGSNWGQKSKTRVSYWWRCISLFAHVFSVKKLACNSLAWKLKQNKCTKKNVSLACRSIWKRPNSRQPVFRPEVLLAHSTRKRPVRESKFNLKKKNYTGCNANSYVYNCYLTIIVLFNMTHSFAYS